MNIGLTGRGEVIAKITEFWHWFSQHEAAFLPDVPDETVMLAVKSKLQQLNEGLTAEMETNELGRRTLVLSTGGNKKLLALVFKIVSQAPRLKWWQVLALRRKKPGHVEINIDRIRLSSDQLFYQSKTKGKMMSVVVWGPQIDPDDEACEAALWLLLQYLVGEWELISRIESVKLKHFEWDENQVKGLKPLIHLSNEITKHKIYRDETSDC